MSQVSGQRTSLANPMYREEYFLGLHFFTGSSVSHPRVWDPVSSPRPLELLVSVHANSQDAGMASFAGCLTFQKTLTLHLVSRCKYVRSSMFNGQY